MDEGMASLAMENKDFRVNVKSKRIVAYQFAKFKPLLIKVLDGQMHLSENEKNILLEEVLTTFEGAVQENILVDGLSWDDAPEVNGEDNECNILDDVLDETIVQMTWQRSIYPKKILPHVVRTLKAERKLMNLFENRRKPQELKQDPVHDRIMNNVCAAASMMFNQASTVMKSLKTLMHTAEGLHLVLNIKPSSETLEAYRDVFGNCNRKGSEVLFTIDPAKCSINQRPPPDTEFTMDYIPLLQFPTTGSLND